MSERNINIAIIGKSGVGKSTFCNYVFGKDVFSAGRGRPVTGQIDDFKHHSVEYEGHVLNLYDSVGLEVNNMSERKQSIKKFIDSRSFSSHAEPHEWLHGAMYLINAASARVEPAEEELIRLLIDSHVPVQVVLTNMDNAKDVEFYGISKKLKEINKKINISRVCSVSIRTRGGTREAFGKEEVLNEFLHGLDEKLKNGMLKYFIYRHKNNLKEMVHEFRKSLKESDIGIIKLIREIIKNPDMDFELDEIFNIDMSFLEKLEDKINYSFDNVDSFLLSHGYNPNTSTKEKLDEITQKVEDLIDKNTKQFELKFSEIENKFDGDMWDKLSGVWDAGKIVVDLKGFIIDSFEEVFFPAIEKLQFEYKNIEGV